MSNEIRPEMAEEADTFKTFVDLLTSFELEQLDSSAAKFLHKAQEHIVMWMLAKDRGEMDRAVSCFVSAIVYDAQVAPVLGAYIAWGRAAVAKYEGAKLNG